MEYDAIIHTDNGYIGDSCGSICTSQYCPMCSLFLLITNESRRSSKSWQVSTLLPVRSMCVQLRDSWPVRTKDRGTSYYVGAGCRTDTRLPVISWSCHARTAISLSVVMLCNEDRESILRPCTESLLNRKNIPFNYFIEWGCISKIPECGLLYTKQPCEWEICWPTPFHECIWSHL